MVDPELLAALSFREAAPIWFEAHKQHIGSGTARDYEQCIRALNLFFSELPLNKIHIGHLEQYQKMRSTGAEDLRRAGPSRVNHELNTLSQILNRAGLWAAIMPLYKPMGLPRPKVGCALEVEQEARLYRVAASNPRWIVAYCCALIMANTTADPVEVRKLRVKDVHLESASLDIIEGVKNDYRVRTVPLNEPALWAARRLLQRAKECGAIEPDHYLLPHRARDGSIGFDPTRPLSSWRGSWNKLRREAGLPWLRIKDMRHHAITLLLENENVSERTVIDLAGHVSAAMLKRYSHIRMKARRAAVEELARKGTSREGKPNLILVKR